MAATAADSKSLVEELRRHRMLEPAQLQQAAKLQAQHADARSLVTQLVKARLLTQFQGNFLLQGQAAKLVVGQYVLLDLVGEGAMGQVYKARHQRLGRTVALKVIRKEQLGNPQAVGRFQREARAAAQLSHSNIVTLFDASQEGDTHVLAMEFVEGKDLARLVKESGPLPVDRACDYVRQAALGLQHAHERGLVHRDIKPANLLLNGSVVKVFDLGLARVHRAEVDADTDPTLTQEGHVMGTPDYMAPEQAKNSKTVDARADLYSLGCTLYFLLTGRPTFTGSTAMERIMQHQTEEPRPIRDVRPEVPKELAAVLRKLMAKRPEDRYQTAAATAEALAPFCGGSPPAKPRSRNRKPVLAVLGLLVLGLGGLAMAGMFGSSRPSNPSNPNPPATLPDRQPDHGDGRHWGGDDRDRWQHWRTMPRGTKTFDPRFFEKWKGRPPGDERK